MPRKPRTIMETATAMLAARAHSISEIRKKLLNKKLYTRAEIEHVIDEFQRLGFLNDEQYAENAVQIMKCRGYGNRKISNELRQKGIGKDLAAETIASEEVSPEGQNQDAVAREVLRRKRHSLEKEPDPRKRREKALRMLAGRGFSADCSYRAVHSLLESMKNGEETDENEKYEME